MFVLDPPPPFLLCHLGVSLGYRTSKKIDAHEGGGVLVGVLPPDPAVLIPPAGGLCVEDGDEAFIQESLPGRMVNNSLLPPVPGPFTSPAINIIVVFVLDTAKCLFSHNRYCDHRKMSHRMFAVHCTEVAPLGMDSAPLCPPITIV